MRTHKTMIRRDNGEFAEASAPVIVSASRSTDIPAFYADWFFERLRRGYSAWTNPFNDTRMYVSYENTRFIVFWTKNPAPLLPHLGELSDRGIKCYIQYTLNDYESDGLETAVPPLDERIETFKECVRRLGKGGVVWRFDPLILTDTIGIDDLIGKIARVGDRLRGHTEKLVFSFADIARYRKVARNLDSAGVRYSEWTPAQMVEFARKLVELNEEHHWHYDLATCAESINLDGIAHNHCIDDRLIIRRAYDDPALMDYLGAEIHPMKGDALFGDIEIPSNAIILDDDHYALSGATKDSGQREFCGCMKSKDIGQYNTCVHGCAYCYANAGKDAAMDNYRQHLANPMSETINGL